MKFGLSDGGIDGAHTLGGFVEKRIVSAIL